MQNRGAILEIPYKFYGMPKNNLLSKHITLAQYLNQSLPTMFQNHITYDYSSPTYVDQIYEKVILGPYLISPLHVEK